MGIKIIALADTIGCSTPDNITYLFSNLIPEFKNVQIGAHLHSTKQKAMEKIEAAYKSGCRSFDVAVHGFGGCPMAADDLTGNMATEDMIEYTQNNSIQLNLNAAELTKAYELSWKVFNNYH
jgi:hydroxymethylglutaryl-CoA lyase